MPKNNIISIMKIIACISVFTAHIFKDINAADIILYIKYNNIFLRTFLGFFVMADMGNVIFFVSSGFLLAFFWNDTKNSSHIIKYCLKLLIPSILIILITALSYYVLSFLGDGSFNLWNIKTDISFLLFRRGSTYYGYQLWYIYYQIEGFIFCSLIQQIAFKYKNKYKYIILSLSVIILTLLWEFYILCIAIGLLFGNIAKDFQLHASKITIFSIFLVTPFIPTIFINYCMHWDDSFFSWGYLVISLYLGILFWLGTSYFTQNISRLNIIADLTFPIYLVHVYVTSIFVKMTNYFEITLNPYIMYIIIVLLSLVAAVIYKKMYSPIVERVLALIKTSNLE